MQTWYNKGYGNERGFVWGNLRIVLYPRKRNQNKAGFDRFRSNWYVHFRNGWSIKLTWEPGLEGREYSSPQVRRVDR